MQVMQTELPAEWQRPPLGELGTLIKGRGGSKRDEIAEGVPVVRYGELYTHHETVIRAFYSFISEEAAANYTELRTGDVLFAGSGETLEEIGKAAVFLGAQRAHGSGDLIILRPSTRVDPLYLAYAVNADDAIVQKKRFGQGSSIFHIHADLLSRVVVPLPPLPEQKKIATILSSVDETIQATQTVIAQTQRIKQGLLQKLLTRGIGHSRFKKTEVGEIPEEWSLCALDDMGTDRETVLRTGPFGSSLKGEHIVPSGRPVLNIQNLGSGELIGEHSFVSEETAKKLAAYEVVPGDLVFSRVADVGRSVVIPEYANRWLISSNLMRIRLDTRRFNPHFVMYQITQGPLLARQLTSSINDAGRQIVTGSTLRQMRFPVPSLQEQEIIVGKAHAVEASIRTHRGEVESLRRMQSGLLQDLLTGKVRVSV